METLPSYADREEAPPKYVSVELNRIDPQTGAAVPPPLHNPPLRRKPPPHLRLWLLINKIISKIHLPIAIIVGATISAVSTWALIRKIQSLIEFAKIDPNPAKWKQQAETWYDACYHGCTDCADPNYAWNACRRIQQLEVVNHDCDPAPMWNWKNRYPDKCLAQVGRVIQAQAFEEVKKGHKSKLGLIVLTMLSGLLGGMIVYFGWRASGRNCARRAERTQARMDQDAAQQWPQQEGGRRWWTRRTRNLAAGRRGRFMAVIMWLLYLGRGARAYACSGHDPTTHLYFTNINQTISVGVYGWLSDCEDKERCRMVPENRCGSYYDYVYQQYRQQCRSENVPRCEKYTETRKKPRDYVYDVLPRVQECGFALVRNTRQQTSLRVANPGIEKNWWVRITVNGYNVTSPNATDREVRCLHGLGGPW